MTSVSSSSMSLTASPSSSTFTPVPIPSSSSPPTGEGNNIGNPGSGPSITSSASLYLYTFLATLVLLLGVSAAIVVRSLVLRRRHRRMIEEAIRNGTWIAPAPGRSTRVDLSKKPKMHEAHLGGNWPAEEKAWHTIMPVAAAYLDPPPPVTTSYPPSTQDSATQTPQMRTRITTHLRSLISPAPSTPSSPLPPTISPPAPPPDPNRTGPLRVAVLVAMPVSAKRAEALGTEEEEELPHIEMGTTDLEVRPDATSCRSSADTVEDEGARSLT